MMVDMMGPKGRGVAVGVSECTFYSSVATFAKIFAEVRAVRQSRVWLGCKGWWWGGVGAELSALIDLLLGLPLFHNPWH